MYPGNHTESDMLYVPRYLKTRPGAPQTHLAYITPDEEKILQQYKPGTPHGGPHGIPNYDTWEYDPDSSGPVTGGTSEQADYDTRQTEWNNSSAERKLEQIKNLRLQRLIKTDYLSNTDVTMPDNIKTWRQSLRDIPQNNTTEEQYDLILARAEDGNLTNEIWSKP